jgi:hypothetical protein
VLVDLCLLAVKTEDCQCQRLYSDSSRNVLLLRFASEFRYRLKDNLISRFDDAVNLLSDAGPLLESHDGCEESG